MPVIVVSAKCRQMSAGLPPGCQFAAKASVSRRASHHGLTAGWTDHFWAAWVNVEHFCANNPGAARWRRLAPKPKETHALGAHWCGVQEALIRKQLSDYKVKSNDLFDAVTDKLLEFADAHPDDDFPCAAVPRAFTGPAGQIALC
ncbi:hypothetical protein [Nonomuraea sp. NPDC049400]|uniref:hypothetical protein n=1 Tax=Nonomuraea sp. NPDC049400 TaxID=3364352 RepID=UPI003797EF95